MSWIEDIRQELRELDCSTKSLRKFSFLVGGISIVLAFWLLFRHFSPFAFYIPGITGFLLVIPGIFSPGILKGIYSLWMGMAFAIGWVVSRVLLVIIFYLVVVPIGLLARISGKDFIDGDMRNRRNTYWVKRDAGRKVNYEKMS